MKSTELLANQMQLIHGRLSDLAGELTRAEWLARPHPGDNRIGFTAWHIVATRDWVVRAIVQQRRPLGWDSPFAGTGISLCQVPFGMSLAEADAIAEAITAAEVSAYSERVTAEFVRWLESADPDALSRPIPNAPAHFALSPRYDDAAYREEIKDGTGTIVEWPAWEVFARPAFAHCFGHFGEIDLARRLLTP